MDWENRTFENKINIVNWKGQTFLTKMALTFDIISTDFTQNRALAWDYFRFGLKLEERELNYLYTQLWTDWKQLVLVALGKWNARRFCQTPLEFVKDLWLLALRFSFVLDLEKMQLLLSQAFPLECATVQS